MLRWLFSRRYIASIDSEILDTDLIKDSFMDVRKTSPFRTPDIIIDRFPKARFSCKMQFTNSYYLYTNSNNSITASDVSLINISNLNIIQYFISHGYIVHPTYNISSMYLLSSSKSNFEGFVYNNVTNLERQGFISTEQHVMCNKYGFKKVIIRFNKVYSPVILILVLLSVILKFLPVEIQSKTDDFFLVFISRSHRYLTQFPKKLPQKVKNYIDNMKLKEFISNKIIIEHTYAKSEYYDIIVNKLPFDIYQVTIFHSIKRASDWDSSVIVGDIVYSTSGDDERKYSSAKIKFSSESQPTSTVHFITESFPCQLSISQKDFTTFPCGRQSVEIQKVLEIQEEIYKTAITSKPSLSNFINVCESCFKRLDYDGLALYILDGNNIRTVCKFTVSEKVSKRFEFLKNEHLSNKNEHKNEVTRIDYDNHRYGIHKVHIDSSVYFFMMAIRAESNILRNFEFFLHAIITMLLIHNHTHIIKRELSVEYESIKNTWIGSYYYYAVFETVNGKLTWKSESKKKTKVSFNDQFERVKEYTKDFKPGIYTFILHMWDEKCNKVIYLVNANIKTDEVDVVMTCTIRDVSNLYGNDIYNKPKFPSSLLNAVMNNLMRVNGTDFSIEIPQKMKVFINNYHTNNFSILTKITESSKLHAFTKEMIHVAKLITKEGKSISSSTIPINNATNDFFFYPDIPLYKLMHVGVEVIFGPIMSKRRDSVTKSLEPSASQEIITTTQNTNSYDDTKFIQSYNPKLSLVSFSNDALTQSYSSFQDMFHESTPLRPPKIPRRFANNKNDLKSQSQNIKISNSFLNFSNADEQYKLPPIYNAESEDIRICFIDLLKDSFHDIKIPSKAIPKIDWKVPSILKGNPKSLKHIESIAGMMYRKDIPHYLNSISKALSLGVSNIVVRIHEGTCIKPYLLSVEYISTVLTITFMSLDIEYMVSTHTHIVMMAMDTINPSGHIFAWRHIHSELKDGIHHNAPSGFHPAIFNNNSFKLISLDQHRLHLQTQMKAGIVDVAAIINFNMPKWYYIKGKTVGDEVRGISISVPPGCIPMLLNSKERQQFANNLMEAFKKLKLSIDLDLTQLKDALTDVHISSCN